MDSSTRPPRVVVPPGADLALLRASVAAQFPGVELDIYQRQDVLDLDRLVVPPTMRKQGVGRAVMEATCQYADERALLVTLTAQPTAGARDSAAGRERLRRFYRQFGFVRNTGRHANYALSAGMYRVPQPVQSMPSGSTGLAAALAEVEQETAAPAAATRSIVGVEARRLR